MVKLFARPVKKFYVFTSQDSSAGGIQISNLLVWCAPRRISLKN